MMSGRPASADLVARGNTSDVWRWSRQTVVKVLHPGIPRHWAALEADIIRKVHDAGLPVPRTDGVVDVGGHPAVILERIDGTSMWSQIKALPGDLPRLVDELVDVQLAILGAGPIEGLPDLAERVRSKIDEVTELSSGERQEALALLDSLPRGSSLCHGDMHPGNLLAGRDGWVVVDWFDAAVGHATADLARSSLLMPSVSGLRAARRYLDGATRGLVARMHVAYLGSLHRRGLLAGEALAAWEAVLAVARMSEPVPTEALHEIWRRWRADPADRIARGLVPDRAGSGHERDQGIEHQRAGGDEEVPVLGRRPGDART